MGGSWRGSLGRGLASSLAHLALGRDPQSSATVAQAPKLHPSTIQGDSGGTRRLVPVWRALVPSQRAGTGHRVPARTYVPDLALPEPALLPPKCICDWGIAFPPSTAQWRPDSW